MKFKFFHQLESIDCGPACLAMVAHHYGKKYSVKEIKQFCEITRMGVSLDDILSGGSKIGLECNALNLTLIELEQVPLPVILFWKQDHFIVLYEIKKKRKYTFYSIADPAYSKLKLDQETIVREWMGNNAKGAAIVLQPSEINQIAATTKTKENYKPFFQPIWSFIRVHKGGYLISCALLVMALFANWTMPRLFGKIIDNGIMVKDISMIWLLLFAQFGIFIGNFCSDTISHIILTKINFRLSILLKQTLLNKLLALPIKYFDTRLCTDTLQRVADQTKIQTFLTWKGIELILSVLNITVLGILLLSFNTTVFILFIVSSILSVIWISAFLKFRKANEYAMIHSQSENNNNMYEFIMHMPEIKVNSAQNKMIKKILSIQNKLNALQLRSLYLNMYQLAGVGFLSRLKEILAISFCGFIIIRNEMTIGALMSVTFILGQLSGPVKNLLNFIYDSQDANIATRRINEIYAEPNEDDSCKLPSPVNIEHIELRHVSFKYPGSFNPFVLNDISFTIPAKKITAIVGESGSGKTTLLKLLLSYYNPESGEIRISGSQLLNIHSAEWRNKCGIVLQDGHIFSGTIAENIAISEMAIDLNMIKRASQIACIDEFIEMLPMGYNTKIGNTGMLLSGGQKQRILIARAVYRNPDFIFFDEATSSLDANTETAIVDNLQTFYKDKTVFIIAHRLSTVKKADQIIVLRKGRIAEIGTHTELTLIRGHYFTLVKNQLELSN